MSNDKDQEVMMAELAKDIRYLRELTQEMKATLDVLNKNMVTREEMESRHDRLQTEIDKRFAGANNRIDEKLDKEDFAPYKKMFWTLFTALFIAGISGGLLASSLLK